MSFTPRPRPPLLLSLALLVPIGSIACSSDPKPPGGSGSKDASVAGDAGTNADAGAQNGAFDPATIAPRFATAQCAFGARCQPFFLTYSGDTEAQCATKTAQDFRISLDTLAPAVAAGRVVYSSQALDRCIAALASADCVLGAADADCNGIFTGQQGSGQPCARSSECGQNLYCSAKLGQCGACQPTVTVGNDCSGAPCGDGLDCFNVGDGQVCAPVTASENEACGTVQTGACRGLLSCTGTNNPTCQRPAGTGQACDRRGETAPDCNIGVGEACINATCGALALADLNAACNEAGGTTCKSGAYCPASGTCTALPQAGAACVQGICGPDAYCSNGTCAPQKAAGQACQSSAECLGDDKSCVYADGAANGTCGVPTWRQCG